MPLGTRHKNGMAVECSLLPRRPCRFGGARRPRAWCRRRPAALAAPRRAPLWSRLARCEVSFGMLALGKDASKLALLACGRGRVGGPARLGEARRGSSSSPPAASQHSSSLDGSLSGMLWACCTASPTLWEGLQGQGGPARARLRAQYYHDYLLSNRAADGGLAQRAARPSTAGCSPPFQQHLLSRFSRCDRIRGPAPTPSLRQRCL